MKDNWCKANYMREGEQKIRKEINLTQVTDCTPLQADELIFKVPINIAVIYLQFLSLLPKLCLIRSYMGSAHLLQSRVESALYYQKTAPYKIQFAYRI
jgi:hypothetical protein